MSSGDTETFVAAWLDSGWPNSGSAYGRMAWIDTANGARGVRGTLRVCQRGQLRATSGRVRDEFGKSCRGQLPSGDIATRCVIAPNAVMMRGARARSAPAARPNPITTQMKPVERLGDAVTPDGTRIELLRHDGAYLIRAAGIELMSTRRHLSEDRLAEVACAELSGRASARALIGGLGLGFTLRAALGALGADAEVVVAELMAEVIAWNSNPDWNISADAIGDSRVRIVHDDVFNVLLANPAGFDAIMLDTDNGPDGMLMPENGPLYSDYGVLTTVRALREGGVIAYWSVSDDTKFVDALERAKLSVERLRVRAHTTAGPTHTIYVARLKAVAPKVPMRDVGI